MSIDNWPLVNPNDDGIRHAGRPDECLYCRSRIGQPHGAECVMVTKRIEMRVTATMPTGETVVGLWQLDEPFSWTRENSEFHKNESTWCANNMLDDLGDVVWDAGAADPSAWLKSQDESDECLCRALEFKFVRIVDGTPRRKLKGVARDAN